MGYYAHSEQSDFYILQENFPKVLDTLHTKYPEYSSKDDLPEVITEFGLTVEVDKHGNIAEWFRVQRISWPDHISGNAYGRAEKTARLKINKVM